MLEIKHDASTLDRAVKSLACRIALPREWKDFFDRSGPLPADYEDRRRFPRFNVRRLAIMETAASLPALRRPPASSVIFTKDIGRGGLSILHFEQLFPCEQFRVWIADQVHDAQVVRCTRVNDSCFEIGASFGWRDGGG